MIKTRAFSRLGAMALVLVAGPALAADGYAVRDAPGNTINLRGHTLGTHDVLPYTALTDQGGSPISPANPMVVAPGIATVTPFDRGAAVTGSPQQPMSANVARKGGWVTADPNNNGTIYVSYTGTATATPGAGKQCVLLAGRTCPLTVNGYVIQTAISLIGTNPGDAFEAVEFQ